MAIRFVEVRAEKAAPHDAERRPEPPQPLTPVDDQSSREDAPRPAEPELVLEGGTVVPGPDAVPLAPKQRGRRAQARREREGADEGEGRAPEQPVAPLLDPLLFPEFPADPKPPPKPRRHRRGFG